MGHLRQSDYRIRKLIGVLGVSLPIALPLLADSTIISSISHYYYLTAPSLYLIIVLSSLGLFLISYKGYSKDHDEFINDDWLTNLAGFAALLVVLIPTACEKSGSSVIERICASGNLPLFGHHDPQTDTYHFIAAGVFIFLMGWMSFFKFTRGEEKGNSRYLLFKSCGILVWSAILFLTIYFLTDVEIPNFVFYMETLAVVPFGLSWLVKGEAMVSMTKLFKKKEV